MVESLWPLSLKLDFYTGRFREALLSITRWPFYYTLFEPSGLSSTNVSFASLRFIRLARPVLQVSCMERWRWWRNCSLSSEFLTRVSQLYQYQSWFGEVVSWSQLASSPSASRDLRISVFLTSIFSWCKIGMPRMSTSIGFDFFSNRFFIFSLFTIKMFRSSIELLWYLTFVFLLITLNEPVFIFSGCTTEMLLSTSTG